MSRFGSPFVKLIDQDPIYRQKWRENCVGVEKYGRGVDFRYSNGTTKKGQVGEYVYFLEYGHISDGYLDPYKLERIYQKRRKEFVSKVNHEQPFRSSSPPGSFLGRHLYYSVIPTERKTNPTLRSILTSPDTLCPTKNRTCGFPGKSIGKVSFGRNNMNSTVEETKKKDRKFKFSRVPRFTKLRKNSSNQKHKRKMRRSLSSPYSGFSKTKKKKKNRRKKKRKKLKNLFDDDDDMIRPKFLSSSCPRDAFSTFPYMSSGRRFGRGPGLSRREEREEMKMRKKVKKEILVDRKKYFGSYVRLSHSEKKRRNADKLLRKRKRGNKKINVGPEPSPDGSLFDSYDHFLDIESGELGKQLERNEKYSHWDKINSALLSSPLPGKQYSTFFDVPEEVKSEIPRVQFGEKEINEEIINVSAMLNDAIQMRIKYGHEFKYPWYKTKDLIREVRQSHIVEYDGTIQISGQVNTGDIHSIKMEEGVFVIHQKENETENEKPVDFKPLVSFDDYYRDYDIIRNFSRYAPAKSFCFERLKFLGMKFELYKAVFAGQEMIDMKKTPYRDFYNVRKIDNHIHLAACMNQKILLNFIREKMKDNGDDVVIMKAGRPKTLKEVCENLELSHDTISVDSLSVRANKDTFHRFDRFVDIFNPFGVSDLRKVFLKVDNHMKGKYFGEICRAVFAEYEQQKYTLAEPRVSIYGISTGELSKIAHWVEDNKLFCKNVRWMIQIPRLFKLHKGLNKVTTFQDFLYNIFQPFFHATIFPQDDPVVSNFLENYLVGFDSVDDESKMEMGMYPSIPKPHRFGITTKTKQPQNPPYAYYNYYFWANINTLNQLRLQKGMSTFSYRPHCGEAGDIRHLAGSFLLADSINHGIQLRNSPVLTYLYYLTQLGLSVSPLSNNYLFLDYHSNPFPEFFKAGMNITLSTDDPLMFHNTKEPLMEEFSISQQVMKLSTADMCEISRNSVLQSGWPKKYKQAWISRYFDEHGIHSNNIKKTNVPQVRIQFRYESFLEEHLFIQSALHQANDIINKSKEPVDEKNLRKQIFLNEKESEKKYENMSPLSRKELVEKIEYLQKNKIQLFAHERQFDLKYWRETVKEEINDKKSLRRVDSYGDEGLMYFIPNMRRVKRGEDGDDEEELEGEDDHDDEMKKDEREIENLKKEMMEMKKKIKEIKRRKKVISERTEDLEKKFREKYFVKRKK